MWLGGHCSGPFSLVTPSLATATAILNLAGAGQSLRRMAWPSGLLFVFWSGVRYPSRPTRRPWGSCGRPVRSFPGWVALAPSALTGLSASWPGIRLLPLALTIWACSSTTAWRTWASSGWARLAQCSFWSAGVMASWTLPALMVSKGVPGELGRLLWLPLRPRLGVTANGREHCLFSAGVLGAALLAGVAGKASLPLGSGAGVAGAVPGLLGESGPPPQRPAKHALMPRAWVVSGAKMV